MREERKILPIARTGLLVLSAIFLSRFLVFAQSKPNVALPEITLTPVPIVGCESQNGTSSEPPRAVASGGTKVVSVNAAIAQRLAFYQLEGGFGVLAPRGWYCYGVYGSSGGNLYVSQEPIDSNFFSNDWKGFGGPVVDVTTKSGGTSGRFEVAQTIARVFPAHMSFVRSVIAEGIEPASSFPSGPYPTDRLVYLSKEVVEFHTPANTEGLGTSFGLHKNGSPINGFAMLSGQDTDLLQLSVRLSADTNDLSPVIIQQFERNVVKTDTQRESAGRSHQGSARQEIGTPTTHAVRPVLQTVAFGMTLSAAKERLRGYTSSYLNWIPGPDANPTDPVDLAAALRDPLICHYNPKPLDSTVCQGTLVHYPFGTEFELWFYDGRLSEINWACYTLYAECTDVLRQLRAAYGPPIKTERGDIYRGSAVHVGVTVNPNMLEFTGYDVRFMPARGKTTW